MQIISSMPGIIGCFLSSSPHSAPAIPGTCRQLFCEFVIFPDGLFGQCQESSLRDQPYFQVTASMLQRLQAILRHLMAQGEYQQLEEKS